MVMVAGTVTVNVNMMSRLMVMRCWSMSVSMVMVSAMSTVSTMSISALIFTFIIISPTSDWVDTIGFPSFFLGCDLFVDLT